MKRLVLSALVAFLVGLSFPGWSQKQSPTDAMISIPAPPGTVCYAVAGDAHVFIPAPGRRSVNGRTLAVDTIGKIKVSYTGFSPEAKKAFQYAVNIWRTLIPTTDTIHIQATWRTLGAGVLGSASPANYYANFSNAPRRGVYYPVALAEKIQRHALNKPTDPDIVASFSSSFTNWYYGTDGKTPSGKYDLVSVVLHEIGHGLGISGLYTVSNGAGLLVIGAPAAYDTYMENTSGQNYLRFPAVNTGTLTNGGLYFASTLTLPANANSHAKLYAPTTFEAGSSIYHLDETRYPPGNKNSLMTPNFNSAEAIHNPGPVALAMLKDIGWNILSFDHDPQMSTEAVSVDFPVSIKIFHDTAYNPASVKLTYFMSEEGIEKELPMTSDGDDHFTGVLPQTGSINIPFTYNYFISVTDNASRTFTLPGQAYASGAPITSKYYSFTAGPDQIAPKITHTPVTFTLNTQTDITLEAIITDLLTVQNAAIQYKINGVAQADVPMALKSTIDPSVRDSTFTGTLHLPILNNGDVVTYRIKATDASSSHLTGYSPAFDYYTINIFALAPAQDSYSNDFDNSPASDDFFGDKLFGISTAAGFTNAAINSTHPYPIADPADSFNYVYQLRIPIKIKAKNPVIQFDEIALIEANDAGAVFGGSGFYDYVVTERSVDGGVTWKPFLTGYNCLAYSVWAARWNFPNSSGVGTPALYISRSINMLSNGKFKAGDEVIIRFRLKSDQLVAGWGWAIDNLKIQVDTQGPTVLHNHVDFIRAADQKLELATTVTDISGVKDLTVEFKLNNGEVSSFPFPVQAGISTYTLKLESDPGAPLVGGDEIQYRILATDSVGNGTSFPPAGFINTSVLSFGTSLDTYVTDFNAANTDFTGNFFAAGIPNGFKDAGMQTEHPYSVGLGTDNASSFQFMLRKKIKVGDNPYIAFREIALVETSKDYVVVEASKDEGVTWSKLLNSYNAKAYPNWLTTFSANKTPTTSLYKNRVIDITASNVFKAGDEILIRFRLFSDARSVGWGWIVDDLSIQGAVTGLEIPSVEVQLYPNPVTSGELTVEVPPSVQRAAFSMVNVQGQSVLQTDLAFAIDGRQLVNVSGVAEGLYLVKIHSDHGVATKKIIIRH